MLVPGDLGFRVVAVFIFVVFPAGFFVFRRKWRMAAARRAEINRLLVSASEEAARAELEASVGYSVTYAVPLQRHCAVCYTPTHNRCARCKSFHYCSGKCQIIHWRQGHKDECHPPPSSFENNEETISLVENSVKQSYHDNAASIEIDRIPFTAQGNTTPEKDGFPSEVSVKDDSGTVDDSALVNESGSLSEIDESSSGDDACIDDSTDDDSLHDLNSGLYDSCSIFDKLESSSSDENVKESNTVREESYMMVDSDSNTNRTEAAADRRNDSSEMRSSSDNNAMEPTLSTSDNWDGSLDSGRAKKYVYANNAKAKSGTSNDWEFPDLKSSLQHTSLSGNLSSDLHSRCPKEPRGTYAGTSGAHKLAEPTLQDKRSTDITRETNSTSSSPKKPDVSIKNIESRGALMKSGEVRPAGETSNDNGLLSCGLNLANNLDRDKKDASPSKKDGFSRRTSSDSSPSGTKWGTAPIVKSTKASCSDIIAPQVTTSTASATVVLKTSVLKVVEQLRAPRSSKQSEATGRNTDRGVFPYELFVKLYHWNKAELRPSGLINCGNSCYANVVLQCLAFTPPLTAYLLQGLHSKSCMKKEWCFTCEFEKLILKAKEGSSVLSPIGILSKIHKIGSHLASGREEDAHEFLRYAIDTMQSICLREAGVSVSSLEEETTLMGLAFGGYLLSKIKCARCHGKSERQERMMDLTVEIEGDIETLEDALRKFTGTECLDGDNKYYCSRCKSYEKAKKKLSILEAPNVLTIALKRFQSGKFGKLNKPIRFPEILNLTPYMRGASDKSPIYRLYGVVVHLDVMNAAFSGHYVCYVRNAHKWYKIDDSMVKGVELDRVLKKGAYMLFYSRCSPRAPRTLRSSIVSQDLSSKIKNPEAGPSQNTGGNTTSRHNLGDDLQGEGRLRPNILELDSGSDTSSLFSNSDEVSSSTDSNRDSISADDISDYIFGYNGFWRHSSDSDTSSSSSSSSSSPLYTNSSLSNVERYVPSRSEPSVSHSSSAHSIPVRDPYWARTPRETCRAEQPGAGVGVPFLQSNSSKQVRNLVNSSSCRGADSERLGWTDSLSNVNSGVHLRRSLRKKGDQAIHHAVLS
ncbi:hypothetical protein Cgig2_029468 [Carnegiea gigantea]|uniref:ubiquitinyl hydrolase 1 n=1 Tax=Carnegiea gigantea TaxID=171969 RepID=A0A9Q1QKN3_9CARY|nr:hypothetical protein Cgig2_029468 [Carnegiea gigantea]